MELIGIILIYAVVIGGMWFLLMRPQKKEQKRVQAMLASMEVGDTALTTSGFYGVIIDITDDSEDSKIIVTVADRAPDATAADEEDETSEPMTESEANGSDSSEDSTDSTT